MRVLNRRLVANIVFTTALAVSWFAPSASVAHAQQASAGAPAGNDWPVYGGNYFNQRFSSLNQINTSNVASLKGVCTFTVDTDKALLPHSSFESSPIEVNGMLFLTGPLDQVFALDATTCQERWKYEPELLNRSLLPLCCAFVNRGVAFGDGKVFIAQLDARLVALDQRNGDVVWNVNATGVPTDSPSNGYSETMAPQFFKPATGNGLVIVGVSGGEYEGRGRITAFDSATGAIRWGPTFMTNQPVPQFDDPAGNDAQSGGPIWQTPAVDPTLGSLYVNVGNPAPDADGSVRPGENRDTDSVVALDLATGARKWGYQEVHHDIWDYDAASPPILFDLPGPGGTVVHGLGQAGKTGWVYLLNRETGTPLPQFEAPETPVPQEATQATNPTQPIPNAPAFVPNGRGGTNIADCTPPVVYRGVLLAPESIFTPFSDGPHLICPGAAGGSEWSPHSFNPQMNTMFVCGVNQGQVYTKEPDETHVQLRQPFLRFGSAFIAPPAAKKFGTLTALDVVSNTIKWQKRGDRDPFFNRECIAGTLATAGGLVFVGEGNGNFDAFDAATGDNKLHFQTGAGVNAPPITYSVNGRQFVAVASGGNALAASPRPAEKLWVFATNGTIGPVAAPATPAPVAANEDKVDIDAFQFQPAEIHIRPGTTVTWKNGDDVAHTATADRNPADPANPYEFSSPLLLDGDEFSHTFTRAGEFPYHCNPHPGMTAKVVVDPNAPAGGEIIQLRAQEPADDPDQAADLKAAVESTLDLDAQRDAIRVPRATIDSTGEATVQFAVRNSGTDPQAVTASALDDVKAILQAVSQSPDASRITNTTVIGTYPVVNESGMVPESIVLRAGLSAERAGQIDWSTLAPQDLASTLDSLWMHPVLTGEAEPVGVVPDDVTTAGLGGQVASMAGHVNMAIEALSSGDPDAARSQFLQFFGTFDDVDDEIDAAYPARFKTLQADVNRVQTAFTSKHRDYDTMRQSLLSLRNTLNGLLGDLQGSGG
jgi:quinohemoprotein ethanol dehydrogenase